MSDTLPTTVDQLFQDPIFRTLFITEECLVTIGEAITREMAGQGVSLQDLSTRSGLKVQRIKSILRGSHTVRATELAALATAFGKKVAFDFVPFL